MCVAVWRVEMCGPEHMILRLLLSEALMVGREGLQSFAARGLI